MYMYIYTHTPLAAGSPLHPNHRPQGAWVGPADVALHAVRDQHELDGRGRGRGAHRLPRRDAGHARRSARRRGKDGAVRARPLYTGAVGAGTFVDRLIDSDHEER